MKHAESAGPVTSMYESMHGRLLSFACRFADPHTAEDLVQEAFARAIEYASPRTGELSISYLKAIVRNLAVDLYARRARDQRTGAAIIAEGEPIDSPADDPIDEEVETLQRELARLTQRQWASVTLTVGRGLTESEVAQADGVSRTAVIGSRERALEVLRRAIAQRKGFEWLAIGGRSCAGRIG